MARDLVLEDLEQIERRLDAELRVTPLFKMLEDVRALAIRRRELLGTADHIDRSEAPSGDGRKDKPTKDGSIAATVVDAAEAYLRKMGRRAQTPEIAREIERLGIKAGNPENMIATISSYLSSAKRRFNNVRGQGYGLMEWDESSEIAGSISGDDAADRAGGAAEELQNSGEGEPQPRGTSFWDTIPDELAKRKEPTEA